MPHQQPFARFATQEPTSRNRASPQRSEDLLARNQREAEETLPEAAPAVPCELCEAARFTHWYFEDDVCWVADCEVCAVPMVVWKPHGTNPTEVEVEHMLAMLAAAGRTRFGDEPFQIDTVMRTIPEHWHAHARDADWFGLRTARPLSRFTSVGASRVERK